ncbi:2-C-methyl-D-erythritol 4-phosphate cytidylyltransferase [Wielerella bovis]|uniref:2-C-methyl-D-erythritol 4-phosphate cytidylyltransferase n=1 Tax=Wielerella bovis TaxID=2917790 RepID=UPI0020191806|nr:2-C-methyl-D-erythritol 4-phosphate cytidylyltransferase [Wielerella bovis]ULJ60581.1 2-C-methyl-D-erythritol 4-phosphate cytidylyltransferase [Wielerella bovis]
MKPHNIALLPAAGVGSRFGANIPKQYARLLNKPVLQHTIDLFAANPRISQIAVVVSPNDEWFDDCIALPPQAAVYRVGGNSRAESIANGLTYLLHHKMIDETDTVLVHDAARCCLPQTALNRLLDALEQDHENRGAILAIPVADTLKRQTPNAPHIAHTVSREYLWQAQTPQAFQAALLHHALQQADWTQITDDASAIELLGIQPILVEGDSRNIKLTRPDDARLAAYFLQNPDN